MMCPRPISFGMKKEKDNKKIYHVRNIVYVKYLKLD